MSYQKSHPPKILKSGTELPLLDMRGKPYLQVAHRLVWFREEYPTATILTEFLERTDKKAVCKATIGFPNAGGGHTIVATAHKSETPEGFADFIEKAETGAIGRALALCGYGTQYEPELDEAERLADAPIPVAVKSKPPKVAAKASGEPVAASEAPVSAATPNPVPETPPTDRKELNSMIGAEASVVVAKRKRSAPELKAWIKELYGVEKKEELTDTQARDFYGKLRELLV